MSLIYRAFNFQDASEHFDYVVGKETKKRRKSKSSHDEANVIGNLSDGMTLRKRRRSTDHFDQSEQLPPAKRTPKKKEGYKFGKLRDYKPSEILYYPAMDVLPDHPDDVSEAGLEEMELNSRRLHRLARSQISQTG